MYHVDLRKIMGVNVAFDIVDNTDDQEPSHAKDIDKMLQEDIKKPRVSLKKKKTTGRLSLNQRYSQNQQDEPTFEADRPPLGARRDSDVLTENSRQAAAEYNYQNERTIERQKLEGMKEQFKKTATSREDKDSPLN